MANAPTPAAIDKTNTYIASPSQFATATAEKSPTFETLAAFFGTFSRSELASMDEYYGGSVLVDKLKDIGTKYPDLLSLTSDQQEKIITTYFGAYLDTKDNKQRKLLFRILSIASLLIIGPELFFGK